MGRKRIMEMLLTRLVEGDVAVLTNPTEEELNTTKRFDLGFICIAFADKIFDVAIKDVHLRGRDVNCIIL